jgi:serine/threonine protein kinase
MKANILIDETGNPRLSDFRFLTIDSDPMDFVDSSLRLPNGPRRWMSPELLDPKYVGLEYSRRTRSSDCYALGMVIYETISGHFPFHGDAHLTVLLKVLKGERPHREPGFADPLWEMMKLCWTPAPGDRPRVGDVLECLEDVSSLPPQNPDDESS